MNVLHNVPGFAPPTVTIVPNTYTSPCEYAPSLITATDTIAKQRKALLDARYTLFGAAPNYKSECAYGCVVVALPSLAPKQRLVCCLTSRMTGCVLLAPSSVPWCRPHTDTRARFRPASQLYHIPYIIPSSYTIIIIHVMLYHIPYTMPTHAQPLGLLPRRAASGLAVLAPRPLLRSVPLVWAGAVRSTRVAGRHVRRRGQRALAQPHRPGRGLFGLGEHHITVRLPPELPDRPHAAAELHVDALVRRPDQLPAVLRAVGSPDRVRALPSRPGGGFGRSCLQAPPACPCFCLTHSCLCLGHLPAEEPVSTAPQGYGTDLPRVARPRAAQPDLVEATVS
jgi:hypothetical protein